jgi:hypothetical protein
MIKQISVWQCTCDICGYVWNTRSEELPRLCSKCKRPTWNGKSKKSDVQSFEQSFVEEVETPEEVVYTEDFGA